MRRQMGSSSTTSTRKPTGKLSEVGLLMLLKLRLSDFDDETMSSPASADGNERWPLVLQGEGVTECDDDDADADADAGDGEDDEDDDDEEEEEEEDVVLVVVVIVAMVSSSCLLY
jgi:U3 small nucleolar RNA-associated protein 14